ncbi:response regulator transcription factor [Streptomyces sp. AK010]|uniref:response regulator n=1 Tax=Streptomyces sp. AK010 TaxID=2723074 RepID=UPI00160D0E29|nr:response regulator transcription factor [Streptomyces sp. AK010]MBB6421376.1 DNA-binding NarL/FixJ family response regulator [Streptomyces sp. AK010]
MVDVIRTVVVDDDPFVRMGLTMVLGAGDGIEVVGEASDGAEAIELVERLRPDVVLMDIRMNGMDGLTATAQLRSRADGPAVIVLTAFDTDKHLLRALRAGANGFLLKDTPPDDILASVRRAAGGESILAPAALTRLIDHVVRLEDQELVESRAVQTRAALDRLTAREREVAVAISEGRSNMDIAASLYMSVATVKANVTRILAKLGCTNRVQVAILVHEARDVPSSAAADRHRADPGGGRA